LNEKLFKLLDRYLSWKISLRTSYGLTFVKPAHKRSWLSVDTSIC